MPYLIIALAQEKVGFFKRTYSVFVGTVWRSLIRTLINHKASFQRELMESDSPENLKVP